MNSAALMVASMDAQMAVVWAVGMVDRKVALVSMMVAGWVDSKVSRTVDMKVAM